MLMETVLGSPYRYYLCEGGYVFAFTCLSVCLQDNSQSCRRILMKFMEVWDL